MNQINDRNFIFVANDFTPLKLRVNSYILIGILGHNIDEIKSISFNENFFKTYNVIAKTGVTTTSVKKRVSTLVGAINSGKKYASTYTTYVNNYLTSHSSHKALHIAVGISQQIGNIFDHVILEQRLRTKILTHLNLPCINNPELKTYSTRSKRNFIQLGIG